MNRRERRRGRMYLLPLLLGLTGMALLVLEWVLRLQAVDSSGALDAALRAGTVDDVFLHGGLLQSLFAAIRPTLPILIYPLILLILYLIRIPSKAARIVTCLSLALFLVHLGAVIYCGRHDPTPFTLRIPGYGLLNHIRTAKADKTVQNILLAGADSAFLASTFTTVLSTLIYSFVKARSDKRNAEFDRRNAYLIRPAQPQPANAVPAAPEAEAVEAPEEYEALDEPDLPLLLPEELE